MGLTHNAFAFSHNAFKCIKYYPQCIEKNIMAAQADNTLSLSEKNKKRGCNFSAYEREILITEYEKVKDKLNNAKVSQDAKQKMWDCIGSAVSLAGVGIRTGKDVRNKFHNLNRVAKSTEMQQRKHLKGTGGGPPSEKPPEEVLRLININKADPGFSGIPGGLETTIAAEKELKVDELPNGDVVIQVIPESDSEAERRAVFDLDTIELDRGSQSTGKEFQSRMQSSSNQQVKKMKTSLQEKVQTAQLEWFEGQNKKVELEMELLREKIATSREKRKLFKALQIELKGKDDMDIIPLVCDE
ncbi:uncharacterized protein LOC128233958 [Mya arenaria]|uniref:uncharacterized protein LOC128224120 n=2 Tax=Mya arenaria TaxID=6604 RepID=UPI0022E19DF2|nr:uncharacterized protein LOC128224120 [Mya arenaria]XP_052803820.1 uncharacterized protein LOC128233958 [Mya arenaria]